MRERAAELAEKWQRALTHGDRVELADIQEEQREIARKLRGVDAPKSDPFFDRKPVAKVVPSLFSELTSAVAGAIQSGKIRRPGTATPVLKNGEPVSTSGALRSQWMEVTPTLATRWLDNNFRNRPLSEDVVQAYARDMANEVWISTHQGIAFNDKDELIDGQHRLHAIVLSGVTVRLMVTFGLPSIIEGSEMTTMDAVDRGRTRSVADQLKIQHGMKDGAAIAAICMSIGGICFGQRTRRLSVGQTLEIFRAFEPAVAWVIAHRSKQPGLRTTGVLAAFAFALAGECGEDAGLRCDDTSPVAEMFQRLVSGVSGEHIEQGMPIARLWAFLTSDEAKLLTRGTDRGLAELVLQAIFLEGRGERVVKLEMSGAGADHFRSLQSQRVSEVAALFELPSV